jgi:cation transport regulator ChaC
MFQRAWSLCRMWVWIRRRRLPPPTLADPVWYFAFGSNMNERLFRERRHMTPIETRTARLDGYRLCFSIAGGMKPGTSAPANIKEARDAAVHGVLYLLPLRKFARLDASEGRQYANLWVDVVDAAGHAVHALTYKVATDVPEGRPGRAYLNLIREAARQRGLPPEYVSLLDRVQPRE